MPQTILSSDHWAKAKNMNQPVLAVGLMSGTSADGTDAVVIRTDGESRPERIAFQHTAHPPELKQAILSLNTPEENELDLMGLLDRHMGERFAEAAQAVLDLAGLSATDITVIGSHGQTIRHRPPHFTLQIGHPAIIAARTRITTVGDFRWADLAQGGEGAPLTPLFHHTLFHVPGQRVAVVNLGGIANITAFPKTGHGPILAGDTGPANTLLDLLAERLQHPHGCDKDGTLAAQGHVHQIALDDLLAHPYLARPFPKSTGRETFGLELLEDWLATFPDLSNADAFATLTHFSALTVAQGCRLLLPPAPDRLILCGGGARNPTLRHTLARLLPDTEHTTSDELGMDARSLEAEAFAWFAVRTLKGLSSSLPEATGARQPAILGSIHPVP
jgi:anhydro-N-acetylmuramic acid kinase